MSVDPKVAQTGQPYAFTNDDPLNLTDPLGLSGIPSLFACNGQGTFASAKARTVACNKQKQQLKTWNKKQWKIYNANPANHSWTQYLITAPLWLVPALVGGGSFVAAAGGVRAAFFTVAAVASTFSGPAATLATSQVEQPSDLDMITAVTEATGKAIIDESGQPYRPFAGR